jgi:two-component system sensor histidine kinase/response regulator
MNVPNQLINVLLIDDDADYAAVAKRYLQPFNGRTFNLIWLGDGEKALTYLRSPNGVHVVLMDYYLRSRNGLEILKDIREAGIELPVIMLTGEKDFRIAVEAMKFGVSDYLVKEEAVDSLFPRSIVNALEQHLLRIQVSTAEKNRVISRKKTEAVQELVVTMCHEFNNPLAAIKISTDILTRQCKTAEVKALLTELNSNISCLEEQIVQLRDLNVPPPAES